MITLERALDILEINDITSIGIADLPKLEKRAKKRWHPDTIAASKPSQETIDKYEKNFKEIKEAVSVIQAFLNGEYKTGEKVKYDTADYKEPEEIIRENASSIQEELKDIWPFVKEKGYKKTIEEVVVSPGDRLRDLLNEDFKDHTSFFSLASFFFSTFLFLILFLISMLFRETQFGKVFSFLLYLWYGLQTVACILGLLPLSRFWLPQSVSRVMVGMINFGMGIYHWYEDELSEKWYFQLLFNIPILVAKTAEYVILYPVYELAKVFFGDHIVRRIVKKQNYYAGGADWYIESLIQKDPEEMTKDELYHLSYMHREFSDVKSKF